MKKPYCEIFTSKKSQEHFSSEWGKRPSESTVWSANIRFLKLLRSAATPHFFTFSRKMGNRNSDLLKRVNIHKCKKVYTILTRFRITKGLKQECQTHFILWTTYSHTNLPRGPLLAEDILNSCGFL